MNAFVNHPQDSIRFSCSCFDRMLLNAIVPVLPSPTSVVGFLQHRRQATALTPAYFRAISTDYHQLVKTFAAERRVEIVEPPKEVRREEWVKPYFRRSSEKQQSDHYRSRNECRCRARSTKAESGAS